MINLKTDQDKFHTCEILCDTKHLHHMNPGKDLYIFLVYKLYRKDNQDQLSTLVDNLEGHQQIQANMNNLHLKKNGTIN